ncbi:glycoside hydrolase family 65 protein [Deinococcus cellulosilyticus]|uniref:Kojibiose phosphorylase n=1 Tax=Deinococcus cellulosilyticus (strain DSM 18568 / NBRC 106333 / KACC 11606 / 5516J-15) TaxID=1223518 RepID=A0A511N7H0_DEIC1|nr:glycosyl hydrolase family 65 protein [Deinococcus cellulosilyticus]GEM48784.1 kojibiose phosphorylase [Deinococcus cellulosilyticus NBRC 106333 = KACC 11606]
MHNSTPHTFPLEAWRITEQQFDPAQNQLAETLFALGNGYIGQRATFEEGYFGPAGTSRDGTFLNGFFDVEPIHYPETAYGLAKRNQFMLNVPNAKRVQIWIEDEPFDLLKGEVHSYERALDFREGVLRRTVDWTSPKGHRVKVTFRRLVSFEQKNLFALDLELTAVNFSGQVLLKSSVDGEVRHMEAGDDPRVGSHVSAPSLILQEVVQVGDLSALVHRTRNSGFLLVSAIDHDLTAQKHSSTLQRENERSEHLFNISVSEGETVRLQKFGAYFTSRDFPESELLGLARETLASAKQAGFDALESAQQAYLQAFWNEADVEIQGDDALQQGIHFNQYHLLQSVGRDGKTNIAAKGVTGEGYEGHYFWDTEIYIFPVMLYTKPDIARKLLEYRYRGLDAARERARQMSHVRGALYPWRTIAGEECSAYFPAGTAQYHINADVAYSVKLYTEVTGDDSFLLEGGAEVVMETARLWMGIGSYIDHKGGQFCINEVTGPDEYTALVNNNHYTNAMAKMHLAFASQVARKLQEAYPEDYQRIAQAVQLDPQEPEAWQHAAEHMYLPKDEKLGIHPQDDTFLSKAVWDFENTPKENYPLLLHYHPLVIYRYQVCKQADVVLALMLLGDQYTLEEKKKDYDYYEPITTHDSSLSSCIFSIVANEVGYHQKAYDYFMDTARMDLDNQHGNTQHGVHTAAMAGTWMGVVYGFAGMRSYGGKMHFNPYLPEKWSHYQFKIHVQGQLLQVHVEKDRVEYTLLKGTELSIQHAGREVVLGQGEKSTMILQGEEA